LTSLDLSKNYIQQEGLAYIGKALTYNPSLVHLKVNYVPDLNLDYKFKTTCHNLQGLLNILIGKDGAQVLGIAFQIKSWIIILF
jgi:hypothetical protein